jgi:hypothetical protein
MLGSPPQSSSPISTPVYPVPASRCEIWQDFKEGFDGSVRGDLSQDPLWVGVKDGPDVDIPDVSCNPVESLEHQHPGTSAHIDGAERSYVCPHHELSTLSSRRERSQSIDPLYLFSSPPQSPGDTRPPEDLDPTNDNVMGVKEAHPVSPHHLPPSSPSLLSIPSPATLSTVVSGVAPPPDSSDITQQNVANEPMIFIEPNAIADKSRYQLRRRGANQLKPYTVEQFQYKQALRANPDAIVKFHGLTHGGRRRYSDEEDDSIRKLREDYAKDSGNREESGRKRAKISHDISSKSGQSGAWDRALVQYPDILQELSSTDEEEAKGFQALSKEARKLERERRANDKLNRKHKTKSRFSNGESAKGMATGFHSSRTHPVSVNQHDLFNKSSSNLSRVDLMILVLFKTNKVV